MTVNLSENFNKIRSDISYIYLYFYTKKTVEKAKI